MSALLPSPRLDLNCSDCGCIEADPDIAGIGAIIAFTVIAGFTLIFCIFALVTDAIACRHEGSGAYPL
ncbi:hypothetical protein FA15DRAFT_711238 [Coprinopsis marcescibilis]|uniref:Uncharacterized protein n=1 Tax=Coprinopsis marcescibilis TaxID=230819 RepID=A0A5C3KA94_COPMA|nr:hypothetical protein FA15DRAFT_711238 [Coprinopsis marcescibilis]